MTTSHLAAKTQAGSTDNKAYDAYISGLFGSKDAILDESLVEMRQQNMPMMHISANEAKLLQVLARTVDAKRILEIGTLGGYSGIHLAQVLPEDGKLVTLERDRHHAKVALRNFDRAGLLSKVEVRVGAAIDSLQAMSRSEIEPFDLVFLDADKDEYCDYLRLALPLLRRGGLLLADNALPPAVVTGEKGQGAMRYNAEIAAEPGLSSIIVPILRQHGIDGLAVSYKL